ncbi:terminase large subunit, partial [Glaesserella parasuis]|uniref:terminase large subunit n=1 Tax=Glaesserella parasuis TaxID=738 RepID=UPI003F2AAE3A
LIKEKVNKLCLGLDFGFTHDPTALTASVINDEAKTIYIFDEHYQAGLITREVAQMIKDKGYQNSTIIADCAEGRLIEELKAEHGIRRIKPSRKG